MTPSRDRVTPRPIYLRPAYLAIVWLGGTLGTATRYVITSKTPLLGDFPLATFMINVCGAFFLGVLLERLGRSGAEPERRQLVRLFAGTGFLGGFTTYSALATDAVGLWQAGNTDLAVAYALGTVLLGAIASLGGIAAGARLGREKPR